MKYIVLLMSLFLIPSCQQDSISSCSIACKDTGGYMTSYSRNTGCQCAQFPVQSCLIDAGVK